jgi:hypothetical protein
MDTLSDLAPDFAFRCAYFDSFFFPTTALDFSVFSNHLADIFEALGRLVVFLCPWVIWSAKWPSVDRAARFEISQEFFHLQCPSCLDVVCL